MGFALETFWCYQLLATKSLKTESMKVYDRLKNGTLDEARYAVSMIVGRDTQSLTEEGVTKAAVETVAENASDGIIAPMFYMAIGGVWLMFLYKGINTMDSMLGYKNDAIRPVEVEDIRRSNRLLYATAILGAVIFLLIGSAVRYCFFL